MEVTAERKKKQFPGKVNGSASSAKKHITRTRTALGTVRVPLKGKGREKDAASREGADCMAVGKIGGPTASLIRTLSRKASLNTTARGL